MPTVTATKSFPFTKVFREWRTCKGQADLISKRQTKLRDEMKDSLMTFGEPSGDGHYVWTFRTPVVYEEGRATHVYTGLKLERRLVPANPTPDPELAEDLLREKGLWMSAEQEKMLEALRISCPNVIFTAEPDVDAVSALYLKKVITEKEYESTLVEQKEQWAFVPQEEK